MFLILHDLLNVAAAPREAAPALEATGAGDEARVASVEDAGVERAGAPDATPDDPDAGVESEDVTVHRIRGHVYDPSGAPIAGAGSA